MVRSRVKQSKLGRTGIWQRNPHTLWGSSVHQMVTGQSGDGDSLRGRLCARQNQGRLLASGFTIELLRRLKLDKSKKCLEK